MFSQTPSFTFSQSSNNVLCGKYMTLIMLGLHPNLKLTSKYTQIFIKIAKNLIVNLIGYSNFFKSQINLKSNVHEANSSVTVIFETDHHINYVIF